MQPTIHTAFDYDGKHILVDWFDVSTKEAIPDLPWRQVYAIGNLDGLVPLVTNAKSPKAYNLPGGSVETGESIEQTLTRELIEECNMRVISWQPLGYQILTEPDGTTVPQMRVYAKLERIGEFTYDPGGAVIKNTLVPPSAVEAHIEYGDVGVRLVERAAPYFTTEQGGSV